MRLLQKRRAFPRILGSERAFLADTLRAETTGGLVLVGAAVIALIWANSPGKTRTTTSATRSSGR